MSLKHPQPLDGFEQSCDAPRKRRRLSGLLSDPAATPAALRESHDHEVGAKEHHERRSKDQEGEMVTSTASSARLASQAVAPFLARHIPNQYAPLGKANGGSAIAPRDPNSKFCYRHRPDLLCRRQADEPSMGKLQKDLDTLSQGDRQGIVHVWSLFSAAPSKHRNLILQGILAQCCFPQLSLLSNNVRELIRIDFLAALPAEVSFRILCFLDTTSLCKAAQVSRRWRQLADDDSVWYRMCEQHFDRKCTKCGWGLPLLERKRLRASKRQIQLRATGRGINEWSPDIASNPETIEDLLQPADTSLDQASYDSASAPTGPLLPVAYKKGAGLTNQEKDYLRKTRPWKDVYKDRFKVGTNWKHGRCSTKIFAGHTNGVMCLQFYDDILVTGSYDATIKVWSIETGKEVRTLRGHTMGIRCLQFDDTKLISGSLDKTLKIWNWRTGECLSTYNGHADGVISLHFDSNILVSGSIDKTAKVWNFEDKSTFTLRGHTDWVNSVRIDCPSRTTLTASDDLTARLWDLDTKQCIRQFKGHTGQVQQVLPLPHEFELGDGELGQSGSDDGSSNSSHEQYVPYESSDDTLSPDNIRYRETFGDTDRPNPPKYILTSGLDSTICLWEVETGRRVRTLFGHVEGVWAIGADTLRIVSGAEDRMVKVWDPRTGRCEQTFTGHAGPVTCIGLSDSRMCSGSEDGEVRMYSFT